MGLEGVDSAAIRLHALLKFILKTTLSEYRMSALSFLLKNDAQ